MAPPTGETTASGGDAQPQQQRQAENDKFNDFGNDGALVWHETNIPYVVWKPASTRTLSMKYYPSEALKNNGSLYAHVFFARSSFPIDPNDPELRMRALWNGYLTGNLMSP
ncbi:hypothetical protein DY000_02013645 [Brassica cretica]|nr:hypothetical protein DY000_02013645 [Brassica cretica]